jgi:polysaccharide export outer membrane protein
MNKPWLSFALIALTIFTITSCGVNSSIMFKEGPEFKGYDSIPMTPQYEYRITQNDLLSLLVYTNDGEKIFDVLTGASVGQGSGGQNMNQLVNQNRSLSFLVRQSGVVELPVIGEFHIAGLTLVEAQKLLKEKYTSTYKDPFVILEVVNQRAIVFNGDAGHSTVVDIENYNTTLLEVIARAGGIHQRGRAKKVRVMRQTPKGREVYLIDLSTMDGLYYADMIIQANDIIYIEPVTQYTREVLKEVAPIVSLLSSAIVVITVLTTIK